MPSRRMHARAGGAARVNMFVSGLFADLLRRFFFFVRYFMPFAARRLVDIILPR